MWPAKVQRQFDIAQAAGNDTLENVLHVPYNKLLNTLFPVDTDFTVIPNFQEINSTKGAEYLVTFEHFLKNLPVFVLLKREKNFSVRSKRTAADDQLRGRLGDLIDACPLPVLHGVSAFGTKLCFYSITKVGLVSTEYIPASPQYVTDTAPVDRWDYDILTDEGDGSSNCRTVQWSKSIVCGVKIKVTGVYRDVEQRLNFLMT
ncbi:hypothetical protein F5888DRAFT_1619057 [Russula emetica]|nr:hypothetical protein F5888DRAFT_1619057 [Russula emetica]